MFSAMSQPQVEITIAANFAPQKPEIAAKKHALALMWRRWKDFIDFETLRQRHPDFPSEERLEILFCSIGMLYGEYLVAHIDELHQLEAELLERFSRELKEKSPDKEQEP
jgi:hypothetical protein